MIKSRFALIGLLGAVALASCTQEVPEIPSSELYTRAFVKEFGAVAKTQDWNNATRGEVKVSVENPTRVKITAKFNGHNYLLGNFADVSGTRTLKFDIPRGISEVTVHAAGESVTTSLGGSVSLASKGRAVVNPGNAGVTAEICKDEADWWVVPFLNATVFRRKMPEDCYNINREGVTMGFMFKFTDHDFILRPLFWQTVHTLRLGMFYLDEEGNPVHLPIYDMEKTNDFSDDLVLSLVDSHVYEQVIENYTENATLMKCFADNGVDVENLGVMDNFELKPYPLNEYLAATAEEDRAVTHAARQYLEDGVGLVNSKTYDDGSEVPEDKRYNYVYRWRFEKEDGAKDTDPYTKFIITYTHFVYDNWQAPTNDTKFGGQNSKANREGYKSLVTKGIKIHVDDIDREYGFYIYSGWTDTNFDDINEWSDVFYSLSSLNKGVRWEPKEGAVRDAEDKYKDSDMVQIPGSRTPRAATWLGEKYNWRYLSFEDGNVIKEGEPYNRGLNDFDLQDIVFLIDGVDPHEVVDKEEPEPEPIKWVVACEDLGSIDDFDFNDVVFEIEHVSGEETARITPLAAGGTLPVYLKYWNGTQEEYVGGEWHALFGKRTSEMVNTSGSSFVRATPIDIKVDPDFTIATREDGHYYDGEKSYRDHMGGFSIEVDREDGRTDTVTPPMEGEAPQMFLLFQETGKKWRWPVERSHIKVSYGEFQQWTGQGEHTVLNAWFDRVTGPVFNRP